MLGLHLSHTLDLTVWINLTLVKNHSWDGKATVGT
jgi:hypothetical protein